MPVSAIEQSTVETLRKDRVKLVTELRGVLEAAGTRALRAEDNEKIAKLEQDIEAHDGRIESCERALELDAESREEDDHDDDKDDKGKDDKRSAGRVSIKDGKRVIELPGNVAPQRRAGNDGADASIVTRWLGETEKEFDNRKRRNSAEYRRAFCSYMMNGDIKGREMRAVQADIDYIGGYLVMPQQFVQTLLKFTDNLLWLRQEATKFQVANAQSLGVPTWDTDPDDSDWTSELSTGNLDSGTTVGKRELVPYPLAKRLKMSNKLLRLAAINGTFSQYDAASGTGPVENFLAARLSYKCAVSQEKAFMTGPGVGQPLGLFVASNRGISTGRDVQTGSSTGYVADQLIAAKYTLKQQHFADPACKWLFHRDSVKQIRQLKDGMGQYLWLPGISMGQPDKLLDLPIMMSEYVPNVFTTGLYVGMLGVFKYYFIADSLEYQITKLQELYAEQNQTGFIVRSETDGMPVLEEAFVRLITN